MVKRTASARGQSMLEALVAIGIIMTAVSSALTLISSSITAEKESENSIVGVNLAREAVEVARNVRDSNWLAGRAWDDGLFGAGYDYTAAPAFDPTTGEWEMLFVANTITDAEAIVYRYTGGVGGPTVGLFVQAVLQPASSQRTIFRRLLSFDAVCVAGPTILPADIKESGEQCPEKFGVRVRAMVQWTSAGNTHDAIVEEILYDWR